MLPMRWLYLAQKAEVYHVFPKSLLFCSQHLHQPHPLLRNLFRTLQHQLKVFWIDCSQKTVPSIDALQKLCIGFKKSPNDRFGYASANEDSSCRIAMQVEHRRWHPSGNEAFHARLSPVCPRCLCSIDRVDQPFCSSCGQKLSRDFFRHATRVPEK